MADEKEQVGFVELGLCLAWKYSRIEESCLVDFRALISDFSVYVSRRKVEAGLRS